MLQEWAGVGMWQDQTPAAAPEIPTPICWGPWARVSRSREAQWIEFFYSVTRTKHLGKVRTVHLTNIRFSSGTLWQRYTFGARRPPYSRWVLELEYFALKFA